MTTPPQVVDALGTNATVRLVGRLSISTALVSAPVFELVRVMVAVSGVPGATVGVAKALAMVTGL